MAYTVVKFSLVLVTYGRIQEVENFIKCLLMQEFDLSTVEIIIVDQNESDCLDYIVSKYSEALNIVFVKSKKIGISYNRNIGIDKARGEIICFPDDDCLYYYDTLKKVEEIFISSSSFDICIGRIFDRNTHENLFKPWKSHFTDVNEHNFYFFSSSIVIFAKRNQFKFDPNFGVGGIWGSNEDSDYLLRSLKSGKKILYFPSIHVWHPKPNCHNYAKTFSYGIGFGALCRKHFGTNTLSLLIKSLLYHSADLIKSLAKLDISAVFVRILSIVSRLYGFSIYKHHSKN